MQGRANYIFIPDNIHNNLLLRVSRLRDHQASDFRLIKCKTPKLTLLISPMITYKRYTIVTKELHRWVVIRSLRYGGGWDDDMVNKRGERL